MNPNDPFAWLTKGDRDLLLVKIARDQSEAVPDLLCYHCQQAAEKFLKALQLHFGQEVKKTHDLEVLLDLLAPFTDKIDWETYDKALIIKNYAVQIRYPNPFGDPSELHVLESIEAAEYFRNLTVSILETS